MEIFSVVESVVSPNGYSYDIQESNNGRMCLTIIRPDGLETKTLMFTNKTLTEVRDFANIELDKIKNLNG